MKLNRFLKRHSPTFRQRSVGGIAVGGRRTLLYHFGNFALRTFKGRLTRHRLILMRIGSLVVVRDGRTYLADPGDAMLVPAGECELTFLSCAQERGVHAEILEFDHRTLAPRFRDSPGWETLAFSVIDAPIAAIPLRGMARTTFALLDSQVPALPRFPLIMGELFSMFRLGLPEFLREHFYRPRWNLFVLLERCVLLPNGVTRLADEYPGGAKQLRKDCLVYLGAEPGAVIARRRCELATAWLRCGHSIDEVGKALGYSSRWEFESAYSGRMRRRCADVQAMPPLSGVEPEELVKALRPYWWPDEARINFQFPRAGPTIRTGYLSQNNTDEFDDAYGCFADGGFTDGTDPAGDMTSRHAKAAEARAARRAEITNELRGRAKDFFAMKSTGADVIIPIFGGQEDIEAMAA